MQSNQKLSVIRTFKQYKYKAMRFNTDRNHATLAQLRNMMLSGAFESIW